MHGRRRAQGPGRARGLRRRHLHGVLHAPRRRHLLDHHRVHGHLRRRGGRGPRVAVQDDVHRPRRVRDGEPQGHSPQRGRDGAERRAADLQQQHGRAHPDERHPGEDQGDPRLLEQEEARPPEARPDELRGHRAPHRGQGAPAGHREDERAVRPVHRHDARRPRAPQVAGQPGRPHDGPALQGHRRLDGGPRARRADGQSVGWSVCIAHCTA